MSRDAQDLRVLFTADIPVEHIRRPVTVPLPGAVQLSADDVRLLRAGLGRVDMELRWMVSLDDRGTLRLFRSWTGSEIYCAGVVPHGDGGTVTGLHVESDPQRYRWRPGDGTEPALFLAVLGSTLDLAADLAAGFGVHPPFPDRPRPSSTRHRDW